MTPHEIISECPAFQTLLHSRCQQIWENIQRKRKNFSENDTIRLAIIEAYVNGFTDAALAHADADREMKRIIAQNL